MYKQLLQPKASSNSHIEWTKISDNTFHVEEAKHGPYVATIVQLAIISLALEYAWQILDMRTNEVVKHGIYKISVAMSLVGADPEDYYKKLLNKVEEELNTLLDLEEIEKILLGE